MNKQLFQDPGNSEYWIDTLADGTAVLIRPLRADDHERDRRFVSTITYEPGAFALSPGSAVACPAWIRS